MGFKEHLSHVVEVELERLDARVRSAPLVDLVGHFGGDLPLRSATGELLEWLDGFSAEHWDFRAGKERDQAGEVDLGSDTARLVLEAATALGMVGSLPASSEHYSHVLIPGGLVRACMLRSRYAAQLMDGGLQCTSVSALSTYRPLGGDEQALVETLGLAGDNEMRLMELGLVSAFGLGEPIEDCQEPPSGPASATAMIRTWDRAGVAVRLVIAPSPEPYRRRANTADTYRFWARRCVELCPADSVLVVTSSIYLPYQHAGALEVLGLDYGCSVETVGIDFTDGRLGPLRQSFAPSNFLQEIRSAIVGMRRLHTACERHFLGSGR